MLTRMAQRLTTTLLLDCSDDQERAILEYGCELCLYTVFSTLGLLLIGTILGCLLETIVMITVFYLCQSNGGGYHATTHKRCFLTMTIGLLVGILLIYSAISSVVAVTVLLSSTTFLLIFSLNLHPNKRYLLIRRQALEKRSRIVTMCIVLCVVGFGQFVPIRLFYAGCFSLFFSAVSRGYALWRDAKLFTACSEIENSSDFE